MNEVALAKSAEAQRARQAAYKATFYGSGHGRDVLFDMEQQIANAQVSDSVKLGLIEFYKMIKASCGLSVLAERAVIDAEANLCEFTETKKEIEDA
jgi:hypothetical protein